MKKFETGKTYTFTFIGDSDSCVPCKVISRTEKTVTIQVRDDEPVRRKISVWNGCEQCYPLGRYSMNPILGADREAKPEALEKIEIDGTKYIQVALVNSKLSQLLREMWKKDMGGGYWYNELNRIIEEGK
jgi:hypothetical protein